jgi:hypothetical protein
LVLDLGWAGKARPKMNKIPASPVVCNSNFTYVFKQTSAGNSSQFQNAVADQPEVSKQAHNYERSKKVS